MGLPFSQSTTDIASIRTTVRAFPFSWALNWLNFSPVCVFGCMGAAAAAIHAILHICQFYCSIFFLSFCSWASLCATRNTRHTQHSICFNLALCWRRNFHLGPYATHCLHIGICYTFHTLHNGCRRGTRAHAHAKLSLPENRRTKRKKARKKEKKIKRFYGCELSVVVTLSMAKKKGENDEKMGLWHTNYMRSHRFVGPVRPECGTERSCKR